MFEYRTLDCGCEEYRYVGVLSANSYANNGELLNSIESTREAVDGTWKQDTFCDDCY